MGENFNPFPADVTLVMPTRGRRDLVAQRLRDIEHRPLLLVIDRGRTHLDLPDNLPADVVVVECEPDCGTCRAMQTGILAARTQFVMAMADDAIIESGYVAEACRVYRERLSPRAGVVATNDGIEQGRQACFGLFPKAFFFDHCYPTHYHRYYQDTDWSQKARRLGVYAYAEEAKIQHLFIDGQDANAMAFDRQIFDERMALFRRSVPRHRPRVMIGLPIDNGAQSHFWQCLCQLIKDPPFEIQFEFNCGDSLVPRARNELTARFLASDCTHLMFIDSDIMFTVHDVERLLADDLDIVAGFYPKKQTRLEYVCNELLSPGPDIQPSVRQMAYMGTGFMLIKRGVFETMADRLGDDLRYISDFTGRLEYDFWSVGVYEYPDGSRRYLSEDWYFCQRALVLGYKVWGDTRVKLHHIGLAVYPLPTPPSEIFAPVPQAGSDRAGDGVIAPARNFVPELAAT